MSEVFFELIQRIKENDISGFMVSLKRLRNINFRAEDGNSILHACVELCNYPALLYTMSRKAELDIFGVSFNFFVKT